MRRPAYRAFARAVGANLDETELALDEYETLGDFFARRLRDGARVVDESPGVVVAPCDGVIAAIGSASDGQLVQAKGKHYALGELLADEDYARTLDGGEYITIYLSPRDYHRVHVPFDAQILGYDFVPGALWPVNQTATKYRDRLLSRNERVVVRMELAGEVPITCALVMVGASGVGNMVLSSWANEFSSASLRLTGERRRVELHDTHLKRGDELGAFHLGSTVVMVFGRSATSIALRGDVGSAVRFGERLGEVRPSP